MAMGSATGMATMAIAIVVFRILYATATVALATTLFLPMLYVKVINAVDVTVLHEALAALVTWADEWQLSVSVNKCRAGIFAVRTIRLFFVTVVFITSRTRCFP